MTTIIQKILGYTDIPYGASDVTINGNTYKMYRQSKDEKVGILSAGLNKVASIRDIDANVWVYAKIAGANYFQMKQGQYDAVNTTYGDISSPLNGVYQSLPMQSSTLFYDLETYDFGDCTGVTVNRNHNVYSPALVYPNKNGRFEFATMVGYGHRNVRSWYTFCIRMVDGYALGITTKDMTPVEIVEDFKKTDMINISFLDGGGSAQMGRYKNGRFEYVRDTGRWIPSVVAIYKPMK